MPLFLLFIVIDSWHHGNFLWRRNEGDLDFLNGSSFGSTRKSVQFNTSNRIVMLRVTIYQPGVVLDLFFKIRQRVSFLLPYAGVVEGVSPELWQSPSPARQFLSGLSYDEDPKKQLMTCLDCEGVSFQIMMKTFCILWNLQPDPVHCGLFLWSFLLNTRNQ